MRGFRFNAFGVDVSFDFWFFAVLALFTALSSSAPVLYFFVPVLLHELGHLMAMLAVKSKIKSISFTAFGVEIKKSKASKPGIRREIFVCLGGIIANLIAALLFFMLAFKSMRVLFFIASNLALALFNLLPIGNLDGGEIARILSEYFFKPRLAFILSRIFSFAALVPLFAAAVFLILQPERNFTLLIMCCYLLVDIIAKG